LINLWVVILSVIGAVIISILDNFEKDSTGLFIVLLIDFLVVLLYSRISKYKPFICKYTLLTLVGVNLLLLFNANGSNIGSSERYYYIPLLEYATDILIALVLFSPFMLLIPMIIYGLFLYSLSELFCKKQHEDRKETKEDLKVNVVDKYTLEIRNKEHLNRKKYAPIAFIIFVVIIIIISRLFY
jgi:hypothetical protein